MRDTAFHNTFYQVFLPLRGDESDDAPEACCARLRWGVFEAFEEIGIAVDGCGVWAGPTVAVDAGCAVKGVYFEAAVVSEDPDLLLLGFGWKSFAEGAGF
jgi:hypothetical protein